MLSIPEEAARLWVAGRSDQDRGWVPRRGFEGQLGLMNEVVVLQLPLLFGRAHASLKLSEGETLATKGANIDGGWPSAASTAMVRSGRHFALFTNVEYGRMVFCVIRPDRGAEGGREDASEVDGHCFYCTSDGARFPSDIDGAGWDSWEGPQNAAEQGDRIGMLLDLDQGSMTVWNNDEKLRVMVAEGLSGPLCWAITLCQQGNRVCIESALAPASPTEEELAAATGTTSSDSEESDDE